MDDLDAGDRDAAEGDGGADTRKQARVLSVAPTYAIAEENYSYRPKANSAEKSVWKIEQGPEGARVSEDGTTVEWQPGPSQKGQHELTVSTKAADRLLSQSGEITVAVPEERAVLELGEKGGGSAIVTAPKSKVRGAGLHVRPSGLKSEERLSISEVDSAPAMDMAKSAPRAVHFGPKGTVFADPALISLPLPEGEPVDKSRVGAFVYDTKGCWVRVPVVSVDEEQGLVYAKAKHFSIYGAAQSKLALDVSISKAAASGECGDRLFVDAWLEEPPSQIDAVQVGNLPAELLALAQGAGEGLSALLAVEGAPRSFRFVRVIELGDGEGADRVALETRLLVTTLYLPGNGRALVTHTDALGNVLGAYAFDSLASSLDALWVHASGRATRAVFAAPATSQPSVTARMHVVYFEGDASLDAISVDDLGFAVVDAREVGGQPATDASDTDLDCDGLVEAFDAVDGRLIAGIVARPEGVVSTSVGSSVRLSAQLVNAPDDAQLAWEVLAGAAELREVAGTISERDVVASAAGRVQVLVRAEVDGEQLSHAFAIDVSELTSPPGCTPSPASATVKQGESVALSAVLSETSLPDSAIDVEWGLWVDEQFVASDEIMGRGHMAAFTPAYASRYELACRARVGDAHGELRVTSIDVVPAQSNLPPVDLTLSPSSATLLIGDSLSLVAGARDPEDATLRFAWSARGGQLGTPRATRSESRSTFSADSAGLYEVRVAVRDESELAQEISAFVLVVERPEDTEGADADGDGWPAPLDCDDAARAVHPGAPDRCGNTVDEDCSGSARSDDCDEDGVTAADGDCDDAQREVRPSAAERCDGIDNDCDESVDEGFSIGSACSVGRGACAGTASWVCSADGFAAVCPALPQLPSAELCDAIDNDCDGSVDEGYAARPTQCGLGACAASGVTACVGGRELDSCVPAASAASDASCNGVDDDCNGQVDEDFIRLAEVCNGRDDNCDRRADEGLSCSSAPTACTPTGREICNVADDDCDGRFDEDDVCGIIPSTDGGLRGVFWECGDAACSSLGEGGLMFLAGGLGAMLESFDHEAYDPSAGPYCGAGTFQYSVAGDELSVSWLEGTQQQTAQGTFTLAGSHLGIRWTNGPSGMAGTTGEMVRVPEQPGGACPHGPVCLSREVCGNGFDDDCDGRTDAADTECAASCGKASGPEICDGLDNDCNGQIDDLKQTCQRPEQLGVCQIGRLVCPQVGSEPTCQPGTPDPQGELCSDGLDNDCDAATDETGCTALSPGETCFNAINVTAGGVFELAKGARNDVDGVCRPGSYVDRVFFIVTPQGLSSQYVVRVDGGPMLDAGGAIFKAPAGFTPGEGCPMLAGLEGMCIGTRHPTTQYLDGGSVYLLVVEAAPDSVTPGGTFRLSVARNYDGICTPADGDSDGVSICAGDCDDSAASVRPGAGELCNQQDDDCDGFVDEQDGTCQTGQAGACATGMTACDQTPACQPIQRSTADYCGDAVDNDCDGAVDDNCVNAPGEACSNAIDVGQGGFFSGTLAGAADDAVSRCGGNGPERFYRFSIPASGGTVTLSMPSAPNGARFVLYRDCTLQVVQCGFKSTALAEGTYLLAVEADGPTGLPYAFTLGLSDGDACRTPDVDGDGYNACGGDCDESRAAVHPGGSEGVSCDGLDNDCNGRIDDVQGSCTVPGLSGVCAEGSLRCNLDGSSACMQTRFPDPQGRDICGDGLDNDCDGAADAQDPQLCATLPAGDVCGLGGLPDLSAGGTISGTLAGYGDDVELLCEGHRSSSTERFYNLTLTQHRSVNIQVQSPSEGGETGYVGVALFGDCAAASAYCGTPSLQLELEPGSYSVAVFGPPGRTYTLLVSTRDPSDHEGTTCLPGDTDADSYTLCTGDCREGDATTWPGAAEVCDGIDNDCDMQIDDGIPTEPCSVPGAVGECVFGGRGCVQGSMQCIGAQPGANLEICNDGKDNDCDGMADDQGQPGVACIVANGETCQAAKPIALNGFVNGSLTGAAHDGNGCYGGSDGTAIERYYRFEVPQPGHYYLQVLPQGAGEIPPHAAGILSGACGPDMYIDGCSSPGNQVIYYYLSTPGPHYVVVESDQAFDYRIGLATASGGSCSAPDSDQDGATLCDFDCAEGNPAIHRGATDLCNGVDDNCDGRVDENGC